MEDLKKKIVSVNPELLNRKILKWDNTWFSSLLPFVKEYYWHDKNSINVFRVVGMQYPDYAGMTWLEFLEKGKRMAMNLSLYGSNPGYYYEARKKEPAMYFQSIDGGDLYIGGDGNHRTCIAKCAFYLDGSTVLHGVVLDDYRVDWEFKRIFDEIQQEVFSRNLPYRLLMANQAVSRDDSGGWMLEKYRLELKVIDSRKNQEHILDRVQAVAFLERLRKKNTLLGKFFA